MVPSSAGPFGARSSACISPPPANIAAVTTAAIPSQTFVIRGLLNSTAHTPSSLETPTQPISFATTAIGG
jgi:hypothetical protein